MYTQKIKIDHTQVTVNEEALYHYIDLFLSALRTNGQILGRYWPEYKQDNCYSAIVMTPEKNTFDLCNAHYYVEKSIAQLTKHKITFTYEILGEDPCGLEHCQCKTPSGYIMYTLNSSVESPIRCADCFYPIPLYKLPTFEDHDYQPLLCWQADFVCCDALQMRC